jgi:formylglycine-generating enzyme required for sulfatase activity
MDSWYFPFRLRFHPVVQVSFKDVLAFCEWKSGELGVQCQPMTKIIWQAAAHAPPAADGVQKAKARPFSWGDEYIPEYCNHPASGFGGTVPVFALPEGRAVNGAYNLIGNAAEWVSEDTAAGGSWLHGMQHPSEFIVTGVNPGLDVGFRYIAYDDPSRSTGNMTEEESASPKEDQYLNW